HSASGTVGRLNYNPRLLDEVGAAALAVEFVEFARRAISEPEAPFPHVIAFGADAGVQAGPVLSYAQERLWFVEQLEAGASQYAMARARRLSGSLDVAALESALTSVVKRHDVLRTRIVNEGGQPRLYIDAPARVPLERRDLSHLEATELEQAIGRLVAEVTDTPFDLAAGRLVRARLIRTGPAEWVLVLAFHHIVMDGMSWGVVFPELGEFYRAVVEGGQPALEPLEVQYADFAEQQRERAMSGAFEAQPGYWERLLEPPLPVASIGRATSGGQRDVAVVASRPLPDGFTDVLKARAAALHITPFMLGLALWAGVLCEEPTSDDVLAAHVAADRRWQPSERLVGYFVNTLPIRLRAEPGASLTEVVSGVLTAALGTYENSEVPLDLILDRVRPDRALSGSLVNGIVITMLEHDLVSRDLELVGVEVGDYEHRVEGVKFDLRLIVDTARESPSVRVKGRSSRFSQADTDRLADRFLTLAEACLADPDLPLRPALVSPQTTPSAPVMSVLAQVEASAGAHPDRVAVEAGDRIWTTAEIDRLSSGIAAHLVDLGVEPGDRVVLAAGRSASAIAAMYGIWKAGAAYVPIEPGLTTVRSLAIVEDCGAAAVVTDDPTLHFDGVPRLELHEGLATHAGAAAAVWADPDRAAYVIYTSGSTGHPKGVVISHRALASFVAGAITTYGLQSDDRILQFHSFAFDASVEEIHVSLVLGVPLVLRSSELLGSAARFFQFIADQRISVVTVPTAFWHEVMSQVTELGLSLPSVLRVLIIGGDAARPETLEQWHALGSTCRLINGYGPTETTVAVIAAHVRPRPAGRHVSIGRPFPEVQTAIVDLAGSDVADGEWGELLIAGPQLATGYLGLPGPTAEAFTVRSDGQRWYHTGDRARRHPDGEYEVSGRFDDQVKIAGYRIEPAEVERVLRGAESIIDAAVIAVVGRTEAAELHAFVVLSSDRAARAPEEIAAALLPDWMVPARFHVIDTLPRTAGHKVDRNELRALALPEVVETPRPGVGETTTTATTSQRVVALWRDGLGLDGADENSDFFEIGGRSLTAVRLAYLIEHEFGVSLPVTAIFGAPTVPELSRTIDLALGISSEPAAVPPIEPLPQPVVPAKVHADVTEPTTVESWDVKPFRLYLDRAPLSFSQQRMWLHQQMGDHGPNYRISSALRIRGPLDRTA
ncbi:MAG: amino acid adenylation domain-containing protein, partial [Acidimicrobiales bacterium]